MKALHVLWTYSSAINQNARTILGQAPRAYRWRLLRAYLRIKLKCLLLVQLMGHKPTRESFLGFRIEFRDYRDFVFLVEEIFVGQEYSFDPPSPAPRILDCGSNIGLSVLYFKLLCPGARIEAFEPDPDTFALLRGNLARNGFEDVALHEAALFSEEGRHEFFRDKTKAASVLMGLRPGELGDAATTTSVATVRLSGFIDGPIDLLKLDVEGSEFEVIEDLDKEGRLDSIRTMVIEYHHHMNGRHADRLGEFLGLLERAGFGYHLSTSLKPPIRGVVEQNVLIYAYRKGRDTP